MSNLNHDFKIMCDRITQLTGGTIESQNPGDGRRYSLFIDTDGKGHLEKISPYLSKSQMLQFLNGFEVGYEYARDTVREI